MACGGIWGRDGTHKLLNVFTGDSLIMVDIQWTVPRDLMGFTRWKSKAAMGQVRSKWTFIARNIDLTMGFPAMFDYWHIEK